MPPADSFYGRGPELAWLRRVLFPSETVQATPLVLIHGVEEVGKTTLVRELIRQVMAAGSGQPAAAFRWEGPVRAASLGQFAEVLLGSGRSNMARLQQSRSLLSKALVANADDANPAEQRVAAYNNDGSVRDLENSPLVTLAEEEVQLAHHFVLRMLEWLRVPGEGQEQPGLAALFRLIFVFDAFETYPTAVKNWLGRHLFPAMQLAKELPNQSIVLTGRQSWESGDQGDYWQAEPASFQQMEVAPLDRLACEQWLQAADEDTGLVDLLLEQTDGFPGRIQRTLAIRKWWEQADREKEGPLAVYSAQQRRWLHAASMARTVNEEILQVLLGRREAEEAFAWLAKQDTIGWREPARDESGERLHLHEEVRDAIIRQVSSRVPARHREFLEKVNLVTDVTGRVDSSRHRRYLGELSPIQPFNEEMIREIFGANG